MHYGVCVSCAPKSSHGSRLWWGRLPIEALTSSWLRVKGRMTTIIDIERDWKLSRSISVFGRGSRFLWLLQVQNQVDKYLKQMGSMTLSLSASRPSSKSGGEDLERITKTIHKIEDGVRRSYSVEQLSGGERRRVTLALLLGFVALASDRSSMTCNLLVLDEVSPQTKSDYLYRIYKHSIHKHSIVLSF